MNSEVLVATPYLLNRCSDKSVTDWLSTPFDSLSGQTFMSSFGRATIDPLPEARSEREKDTRLLAQASQ